VSLVFLIYRGIYFFLHYVVPVVVEICLPLTFAKHSSSTPPPIISGYVFLTYKGTYFFALRCTRVGRHRFTLNLCEALEFSPVTSGSVLLYLLFYVCGVSSTIVCSFFCFFVLFCLPFSYSHCIPSIVRSTRYYFM